MTQRFVLHANDPERARIAANLAHAIGTLPSSLSFQVSIDRYVKPRTLKQNATLFAVAYKPLMEFIGLAGDEEKTELHREFCGNYFGWTTLAIGRKPKRTTTRNEKGEKDVLTRREFAEFYDFVVREASKIGCVIPSPNPFLGDNP